MDRLTYDQMAIVVGEENMDMDWADYADDPYIVARYEFLTNGVEED